jgi:hypothetical protein
MIIQVGVENFGFIYIIKFIIYHGEHVSKFEINLMKIKYPK